MTRPAYQGVGPDVFTDCFEAYLAGYGGGARAALSRAHGEPSLLAALLGARDAALGLGMRSIDSVRQWERCCAEYVSEHLRASGWLRAGPRGADRGDAVENAEPDSFLKLVRYMAHQDAATRNTRSPVELADLLQRLGSQG